VRANVATCARLAAAHDHPAALAAAPPPEHYMRSAGGAVLQPHALEPLLLALSDTYQHIRELQAQRDSHSAPASDSPNPPPAPSHARAEQQRERGEAPPPPPLLARFRRKSTKFWFRPAHALRLKLALLPHLPVHTFRGRAALSFGCATAAPAPGGRDSALVSSVYFDDSALSAFQARLGRPDGAAIVRARWYDAPAPPGPPRLLFLERKLHREPWTGEASEKARVAVTQPALEAFLDGAPLAADDADARRFGAEVAAWLAAGAGGERRSALLRTRYRRTAFQAPEGGAAVRVSLDVELCAAREGVEGVKGWG